MSDIDIALGVLVVSTPIILVVSFIVMLIVLYNQPIEQKFGGYLENYAIVEYNQIEGLISVLSEGLSYDRAHSKANFLNDTKLPLREKHLSYEAVSHQELDTMENVLG